MKLGDITTWLLEKGYQIQVAGDVDSEISGFASLTSCTSDKITWVKKKINYDKIEDHSGIKAAVVQTGIQVDIPNQIIAENSKEVFFAVLGYFWGTRIQEGTIGEGTYISPESIVDPTATIGNNCSIVGKVSIGKHTIIEDNVCIRNNVQIGDDCIIHSGVIIGKDGFGFAFDENHVPVKVPHFGGVRIGNRVEIGANSTIDRGTIDDTIIGNDVKIDNLVLIAHNVRIDDSVLIIGCTDVAGSSHIGEKSYIGPQTCIKNQVSVGKNSFIGMNIMLNESVDDDTMVVKNSKGIQRKCKDYRRFI